MDKIIYYMIAETTNTPHVCKDCKLEASVNHHLIIAQNIETNQMDILCEECLKNLDNYVIVKERPEKTFVVEGTEYTEVPCEGCPGKKFKVFKKK